MNADDASRILQLAFLIEQRQHVDLLWDEVREHDDLAARDVGLDLPFAINLFDELDSNLCHVCGAKLLSVDAGHILLSIESLLLAIVLVI